MHPGQELAQLGARLTLANKRVAGLQLDLKATQTSLHAKDAEILELMGKLAATEPKAERPVHSQAQVTSTREIAVVWHHQISVHQAEQTSLMYADECFHH